MNSMNPWFISLGSIGATALSGEPSRVNEASGNLSLTSDYIFRGFTQARSGPAIQGSINVTSNSGIYTFPKLLGRA